MLKAEVSELFGIWHSTFVVDTVFTSRDPVRILAPASERYGPERRV
jgi:hypothetical protein